MTAKLSERDQAEVVRGALLLDLIDRKTQVLLLDLLDRVASQLRLGHLELRVQQLFHQEIFVLDHTELGDDVLKRVSHEVL